MWKKAEFNRTDNILRCNLPLFIILCFSNCDICRAVLPGVICSQYVLSKCWTCGLLGDVFFLYLCCASIIVLMAILPAHYYIELNYSQIELIWKFKSNIHYMELKFTIVLNWTFTGFSVYDNMYWTVPVPMCRRSVLTPSFFWDAEFGGLTILRIVMTLLPKGTRHDNPEDGSTLGIFLIITVFPNLALN